MSSRFEEFSDKRVEKKGCKLENLFKDFESAVKMVFAQAEFNTTI